MKEFLRMIDVVRNQGIADMTEERDSGFRPATSTEWTYFEKCQPFVFMTSPREAQDILQGTPEREIIEVDAPFPVFSIETIGDALGSTFAVRDGKREVGFLTHAVMTVELGPKEYSFYSLVEFPTGQIVVFREEARMAAPIVHQMLKVLARQKIGTRSERHVVKLGAGKEKRQRRIRRVIHVASKADVDSKSEATRDVDWSHRFEVRGHWRKHEGLGKDRDDNYCVHGWTWIRHHVKGPEDKPLVKKVRVVDERNDDDEK